MTTEGLKYAFYPVEDDFCLHRGCAGEHPLETQMVDIETEYGTRVGYGLFAGAHVGWASGSRGPGGGTATGPAGILAKQAQWASLPHPAV